MTSPGGATGGAEETLFARLKTCCAAEWETYCRHPFVQGLADGTLPEANFRHYLGQDYLFLIHFARAYGLAVYKSETLADMRTAAAATSAILDVEMKLHVEFCAGWGLSESEMEALPEARATMAYTRFVLERGMAGDILDLHAALAPCVVGYGEIGRRLIGDPATRTTSNAYLPWIEMYAGAEYQQVAAEAVAQLDRLASSRLTPDRFGALAKTFAEATRLETGFWEMGWSLEA